MQHPSGGGDRKLEPRVLTSSAEDCNFGVASTSNRFGNSNLLLIRGWARSNRILRSSMLLKWSIMGADRFTIM